MTDKTISLALQGGGAHGAFTWGALDRLLEDDGIEIEAVTATSAGAMNAAALKQGLIRGGNEGARQALSDFWLGLVGLDGNISEPFLTWLEMFSPPTGAISRALEASPAVIAGEALTRVLSPYQLNPFNFHPLRAKVDDMLEPDIVCSEEGPRLYICATNVRSGRPRIFSGAEVTTDAILASACLPTVFQAVEIFDPETGRDEAYWDGGYMGNPALYPLFDHTACTDILIVHINPLYREELPTGAQDIVNRINEISFNASLLRALGMVWFAGQMVAQGTVPPGAIKPNYIHSVRDDELMSQLGIASKMTPNRALLLRLMEAGRQSMDTFLTSHRDDIGQRSSLDLDALFAADRAGYPTVKT